LPEEELYQFARTLLDQLAWLTCSRFLQDDKESFGDLHCFAFPGAHPKRNIQKIDFQLEQISMKTGLT